MRTERYLYTELKDENGKIYARMLYDHRGDPGENVNIAELPANSAVVERMSALLRSGWRSQIPG